MNSAIGIDIGGTKIALGVVTFEGRVLAHTEIPTAPRHGFSDAVSRMVTAIGRILRQSDVPRKQLAGIGVGCAGPVDSIGGEIRNPYTLPGWEGCNLVQALADRFQKPVWLENDADAAALGEFHDGAGKGVASLVMLTIGTGVGGGVILDGKILRGERAQHPEMGHMIVAKRGPECYCGRRGCLESIVSGTAIASAGKELGLNSAARVFSAAAAGHLPARKILRGVAVALESALWSLCHAFAPGRIILGGGLVGAQPQFFIRAVKKAAIAPRLCEPQPLVSLAQLGKNAGLIGAARCAMHAGRVHPTPLALP